MPKQETIAPAFDVADIEIEKAYDGAPDELTEKIKRAAGTKLKDTPYAFGNDGQIYVNNRAGRRNPKRVWRSVIEHKTGIGKAVNQKGGIEPVMKLRYFTQHVPTRQEILKRRKAERQNRGK